MVGAAAESIVLDIRDALVSKLNLAKASLPKGLTDWRVKLILGGIEAVITTENRTFQSLFLIDSKQTGLH